MKLRLLSCMAAIALPGIALANCPSITVADMGGVAPGAYPQQYELAEFEAAAGCSMAFSSNPDAAALNARIQGNGDLPSLTSLCLRSGEKLVWQFRLTPYRHSQTRLSTLEHSTPPGPASAGPQL